MGGQVQSAPRVMLAATASGVGKTSITCGVLRLLMRRGLRVQACKCGPDYLDPLFHEQVLGTPSRTLDTFLGGEGLVRSLVAEGARDADLTVMEGVMGYYDGIGQTDRASSYDVARATRTPVVLVVDARGRSLSCAAEVAGFCAFRDPSQVAGVILNRVSAGFYPRLKAMVERETGVPVLGYAPEVDAARLESRHLGLVTPAEVPGVLARLDALADVLERTLDVEALLAVASGAASLACEPTAPVEPVRGAPRVAVARDEAFCFYYHDTLALLERLGARVVPFSPLSDERLPEGICGLYLGGGYPELHARGLSDNEVLRAQLRGLVAGGLPTVAECGGFLYLQEELEDASGTSWPMVGALAGRACRQGRLVRFGYATLTARRDSLLARAGEELRAHEFHYWDTDEPGDAFRANKAAGGDGWDCIVATPTLHAGFPHLYLPGSPDAARRFVEACARYGARQGVCRA